MRPLAISARGYRNRDAGFGSMFWLGPLCGCYPVVGTVEGSLAGLLVFSKDVWLWRVTSTDLSTTS